MHSRNPQILTTLKFFTDNLVIGYEYWSVNPALDHLCSLVANFQLSMACRGLFIRGGISIGTLASDERIVFGDCLVKAHEIENKIARNPRVVLDPCFSSKGDADFIQSASRLMRDVDGFFFVNYLSELIELKYSPSRVGPCLNEDPFGYSQKSSRTSS
jgi:hypothetical protein